MADTLFFEETDGLRRKVFLRGTTAPHGGVRRDPAFSLGGTLRSTRAYEPGVRRPVRHVNGSAERDIEIRGHLRDGLLGVAGEAKRLKELIEDIRREGRELLIGWDGLGRVGFLTESEFPVEGKGEYQYRLKFEIDDLADDSSGLDYKRARRIPFPADMADIGDELAARKAALLAVPGLSIDIASSITDLYASVSRPLVEIVGFLTDIENGIEDTKSALRACANSAAALLARLEHLSGYLDGLGTPLDVDDGASIAAWERARAEALLGLMQATRAAYLTGAQAERQVRGETSGRVYVAADGDTLEAIAAREGTTIEAILDLNPGLPFTPAAGTRIRLP